MRIALALAALLTLGACDLRPRTAEWQNVCVESHEEFLYYQTTMTTCGTNCSYPVMTPVYNTVCDREERRCIGGKDGSNYCLPEQQ